MYRTRSDWSARWRADLRNLAALVEVRSAVFAALDPDAACLKLYELGYLEGRIDGLRLVQGFDQSAATSTPGLPLLFELERGDLRGGLAGRHLQSPEADAHLEVFQSADDPMCLVTAGYAAGWFSEILRDPVCVRETGCRARGDDYCTFEVARENELTADPIDTRALAERARDLAREPEADGADECEGEMLGQFDPLSPAAHIWGPVMILPYAGSADSVDALLSIEREMGPDQVRVVVVDVTGARIDALEASGLARVLDRVAAMGVEAILVGLDRADTRPFLEGEGGLCMPLVAGDISEGIALGFQMCQAPPGIH